MSNTTDHTDKLDEYADYIRCHEDPVYFVRKYMKLQHPTKSECSFDLYPEQANTLAAYFENTNNITLASRQVGATNLLVALALWQAVFTKNQTIAFVAANTPQVQHLIANFLFALDRLPTFLRPAIKSRTRSNVELYNGVRLITTTPRSVGPKGVSVNCLLWDCASHGSAESANTFWEAFAPVFMSLGSRIVISTTGIPVEFNREHLFARLWDSGNFHRTELKWESVPYRDAEFKEHYTTLLGEKQWRREYECEF